MRLPGNSVSSVVQNPTELQAQVTASARKQVQQWIDVGVIVLDNAVCTLNATFLQGKLMVNGKPIEEIMSAIVTAGKNKHSHRANLSSSAPDASHNTAGSTYNRHYNYTN